MQLQPDDAMTGQIISIGTINSPQATTNPSPQAHQGNHTTTFNTEDIADHIIASLPASMAPLPFNTSAEANPWSTAPRAPSAPTPTPSQRPQDLNMDFTPFPRPFPEVVSSVFPTKLPPRLASKQFPMKRFFNRASLSASAPPPRSDGDASNAHTLRTPDIEMGGLRNTVALPASMMRQAQADSMRRLKFWLLLTSGWILCMGIGFLVYAMVRDVEEKKQAVE